MFKFSLYFLSMVVGTSGLGICTQYAFSAQRIDST